MEKSAGIILYRVNCNNVVEFFVGHPGGKYWANKDYWSYLKGGINKNESILTAALREFKEESGIDLNNKDIIFQYLGSVKQSKQKRVYAYAVNYSDFDIGECKSNMADNGENYEIDAYSWKTYDELKVSTHPKHLPFYESINSLVGIINGEISVTYDTIYKR